MPAEDPGPEGVPNSQPSFLPDSPPLRRPIRSSAFFFRQFLCSHRRGFWGGGRWQTGWRPVCAGSLMTSLDGCRPLRETHERLGERCTALFPCLSDPGTRLFHLALCCSQWVALCVGDSFSPWHFWAAVRRSSLGLKVALLALHVVVVGFLFAFDGDLIRRTRRMTWYSLFLISLGFSFADFSFVSLRMDQRIAFWHYNLLADN